MNIRDLQYLVAVYDCGNFSKAAAQCFVSQPTLSGQLKKLELELGGELMERTTRRVFFTHLGEQVVKKAREVLLTVEQIKELGDQASGPFVGDFHLGMIPTIGPYLLPILMPEITKQFPQLNIYLYELQTEELLDHLIKGKLDGAVAAKLDWELPLIEQFLYREEMKLAVGGKDVLSTRTRPVSLSVLEDRSVLMLEDGHCLRDQALGYCFSAGAKEDARFQATSMDTLLHMVASGTGMTLVPNLACTDMADVHYLSFNNPKPSRDIVMLARNKSSRVAAVQAIAGLVTQLVV